MKFKYYLYVLILLGPSMPTLAEDAKKVANGPNMPTFQQNFMPAVGGVATLVFTGIIVIALMVLRYVGSITTPAMTQLIVVFGVGGLGVHVVMSGLPQEAVAVATGLLGMMAGFILRGNGEGPGTATGSGTQSK